MSGTRAKLPTKILKKLEKAFKTHLGSAGMSTVLKNHMIFDKAYELSSVLAMMTCMKLQMGGLRYVLSHGGSLNFRQSRGPIDRARHSRVDVHTTSSIVAEIWLDVEIMAYSAAMAKWTPKNPTYGNAHELDAVVVKPGTFGHPEPTAIHLGLEAKHRAFDKSLLKELLGVRREMCILSAPTTNRFVWWTPAIPTEPNSGLVLFCSGPTVKRYTSPAAYWGIKMILHRI